MTKKELGLKKVLELVERFKDHQTIYKKSEYNETQTRIDFIDPFFKALGWDIDNENSLAESWREVIHEDKIKISGKTKAPDYSFRISGKEKLFYVEAKKPFIKIKDDIDPAYQIKRYGWNAGMTVSVLTDFEELSIYDCTKEPKYNDKPQKSRLNYITFHQYEEEWDFLWSVLSKEAAADGRFNEFLKKVPQKKGTDTVDKRFLKSLDEWRTLLAENISKDNKGIDEDELNYVVQQTLDRIIFLRICEDRSIEPYGRLKECVKRGTYYTNLLHVFQQADDKYNSGLFNFKKDKLSPEIIINNKTLEIIISQLYYPECPYEFSVLSVEILGSAYEQFLGKTITINKRGKAVIELKPEVRKAGGVYYTPEYIVDYILKNTIGKLCEKKNPAQVAEFKIVDPSCGSGSFLIGAYQYLLNWHKDYYLQNPNKKNPITPDGNLTTKEKKRILLNNIFGVDIDTNAVEVTKLSLLLKCLEGETNASIAHQMKMFNERVLPTLDENIKSGNSLINTDFYDNQIDFGEEKKIKPFNWKKGFSEVFKQGGFDVVIGNPPYVSYYSRESIALNSDVEKYFRTKYAFLKKESNKTRINSVMFFLELASQLLNKKGQFSFIIDFNFYEHPFIPIRKYLISNLDIVEVVDKLKAFVGVASGQLILTAQKEKKEGNLIAWKTSISDTTPELIPQNNFNDQENFYKWGPSSKNIDFDKILADTKPLSAFAEVITGVAVYANQSGRDTFISEKKYNNNCFPLLEGGYSIYKSYCIPKYKSFILYDKKLESKLNDKFDTDYFKANGSHQRPFNLRLISDFDRPKLFIRQSDVKITATYTEDLLFGNYSLFTLYRQDNSKEILYYLLGLLNSKLITKYCIEKEIIKIKEGKTPQIRSGQRGPLGIRQIPIKEISENDSCKKIIKNVLEILRLNQERDKTKLETKINQLQNKIDYCEEKINECVYELYNLTEEQIELVESD